MQLDKVQDKIATGGPVGSSGSAGTSVIQPATEPADSRLMRLLYLGTLGQPSSALILAAIVLLATARRDPRLRLRDDIADAVGSPVLAAVQE